MNNTTDTLRAVDLPRLVRRLANLRPDLSAAGLSFRDQDALLALIKWAGELDELATNTGEYREWHGDLGWVYPGQSVYHGERLESVVCSPNDQIHP